jgi:hypothetical protein
MLEEVDAALRATIGEAQVPRAYVDFQLCRELHLTPRDLEDMDEATYRLWLGFLRTEGNVREDERRRQEFLRGG